MDHAEFIAWAQQQDPGTGYALVAVATFLEYLIPILPSELLPTLCAVVTATADWSFGPLVLAGALGSTAGGLLDYAVGRYMVSTSHDTWLHRLFRRPQVAGWVQRLTVSFERYGTWYILLNRFLPPLRLVLFVVAGMARLPAGRVTVAAFSAAIVWMLTIVAVGYALGFQLETAMLWLNGYLIVMTSLVLLIILGWVIHTARANRQKVSGLSEQEDA